MRDISREKAGENMKIILASGSPRRRELLDSLGWSFSIVVPSVDESMNRNEAPEELAIRLAGKKARAAAAMSSDLPVVAADTVVEIEGRILGKPLDLQEAVEMLSLLQGKCHRVITGLALMIQDRITSRAEITRVCFRPLEKNEIEAYVRVEHCLDKAGGYAIQGRGSLLVENIEGCYYNVVGLPLYLLSSMLEDEGFSLGKQWR